MKPNLVLATKSGTLDAFCFNRVHVDSQFWLSISPFSPVPLLKNIKGMEQIRGADINIPFLHGLFSYCYLTHYNPNSATFTVNVHELRVYLGLSCGGRRFDVCKGISDLGKFFGVINNHGEYKLVSNIVTSKNSVTFKSFYFQTLINYMKYKSENSEWRSSFYTSLVKSEIVKCRNKSAVEIVLVLVSLIVRRGTALGGTSQISVAKLLAQCPALVHRINNSKSGRKNYVLKSAWETALEYLNKSTLLNKMYSSVKLDTPDALKTDCLQDVIHICVKQKIKMGDGNLE